WPALVGVLAAMLLKVLVEVLKPWPLKILVDQALSSEPMPAGLATGVWPVDPETLVAWCVAATVVLFLLGWLANLATAYANVALGQRLVYDLAGGLFGHLQRLSLRFHHQKAVGDTVRRVTTDCSCIATLVRDAILPVLAAGVTLAAMCV